MGVPGVVGDRYSAVNDIVALKAGGFAVFSAAYVGSVRVITLHKYDNTGAAQGDPVDVITPTSGRGSLPFNVNVAGLKDGNLLLTWEIYDDRPGETIARYSTKAQIVDVDGALVGAEMNLSGGATSDQRDSEVTASKNGGFILTWRESSGIFTDKNDIFVQKFNADGSPISAAKRANTVTFGEDSDPVVTELANGKFVVSWWGGFGEDGDNWGAFAQMFNKNGGKSGDTIQLNTYTDSQQWAPDVEALPDGGFIATWQSFAQDGSGGGIFGQRFDAKGVMVGDEFQVNTSTGASQWYSNVEVGKDGGFIVTWQSQHQGGNKWLVMAQQYEAQTFGTVGNNKIRDKVGADWIDGQGGNDKIWGLSGNDKIYGNDGNDALFGGFGKDKLYGGKGNDKLVGEKGNDLLKGGAGDDILNGGKGNDKPYGDGGMDTFLFKAGKDGRDKIFGFEADQDVIQISNATSVSVSNSNGNTVIDYDGAAGSILLKGMVLTEADITFDFV